MTVESAIRSFAIDGELVDFEPLVRGHINRTFVSTWSVGGARRRYLHQCINDHVFADMASLMHNVELVTRRLGEALEVKPSGYEALRLVFTREGEHWLAGPDGSWRTYHFVEGTESHDRCAGPEQAFEVARIFGWFQHALSGLDSDALAETIPDFFSPGHRLRQFEGALAAPETDKTSGRRAAAADAIAFVLERHDLHGPVNAVAPRPVTNRELTRCLAQLLRRPALLPVPAPALRLLLGEMGTALLLASQRVRPEKLRSAGFEFEFPELEPALRDLLTRTPEPI